MILKLDADDKKIQICYGCQGCQINSALILINNFLLGSNTTITGNKDMTVENSRYF